jgi:hypothetical protein
VGIHHAAEGPRVNERDLISGAANVEQSELVDKNFAEERSMTPKGLATDIDGVRERLGLMFSEASRQAGHEFPAIGSDIIIATYPKCGTTMMQQIVHGLRTDGDMDFTEITLVVPWLETAQDYGIDLHAPQKATPRAFKSHQTWQEVPKGAKYIYVIRDPKDVAVSFYRFFEGWVFEPGSIDINTFATEFLLTGAKSGSYANHLTSWWHKRDDVDTLMLSYENIINDLPSTVRTVAEFCTIVADPRTLEVATRQAGFEFMRTHADKFNDYPLRAVVNPRAGLPVKAGNSKVQKGEAGSHKVSLSDETLARYDAVWEIDIAPVTGHKNYQSLRAELES